MAHAFQHESMRFCLEEKMGDLPKEILDKVKEVAKDGKLSCPKARKLAKDLGVPPHVIGEVCDELNIKIKDCELGCF